MAGGGSSSGAGGKRKMTAATTAPTAPAGGGAARETNDDELNSDDDEDDDDAEGDESGAIPGQKVDNTVFVQFDKVKRVRDQWRVSLRAGIANINGKSHIFSKCDAEFVY